MIVDYLLCEKNKNKKQNQYFNSTLLIQRDGPRGLPDNAVQDRPGKPLPERPGDRLFLLRRDPLPEQEHDVL